MKKILIAALSVLTTGCGIYNKYERPDLGTVQTDSLYRSDAALDTASSIASLGWEELFTDPCLQSLIHRGLEANTDLQTAALRVKEAQATLMSSKLAYLPSLQLDPQGNLSSFDGSKTQKTYSLGGSASWEIDLFGKLTNAKRGARAALLESEAYRQAMQTQVIATVADSYYALSSLLSLQRQVAEQENALCVFIGEVPHRLERGTLNDQQFPDRMSVGLPIELLSRRPDVRQAEASLMQAFYATNSARSAFYPSITLSGSAGWTNSGGAAITNPGAWLLQAVNSQSSTRGSGTGLQTVAARCRTGGEQCPHPMADSPRTDSVGHGASEAAGNHRFGYPPADAIWYGELSTSAHRPPITSLGPTDIGIRPLQRNTGSHQPLPCFGWRS